MSTENSMSTIFSHLKKNPSSTPSTTEGLQHDLQRGDHVIRWTRIVIYPIQVHGVVISASSDAVTIVDFGVSSDAVGNGKHDDNDDDDATKKVQSLDAGAALEDIVSQEDIDMMEACEKYTGVNKKRVNIRSITDMKDITQWKKVNYGESINKGWKWWWKSDDKDVTENDSNSYFARDDESCGIERELSQDEQPLIEQELSQDKQSPKSIQPPELPDSDPTNLVLSRVRYILHDPSVLPPHNLFYSNSECIAVWCKTGRWSTLQASIFLHSTAAGQLKSAATLATVAGTTTVTQVIPAGGVAGWFGMTTTTTVGLLSLQPWLIPVLAGYGLVAVGTPLFIMSKARAKWEKTTMALTDGFWGWADNDVYVDAVKSWSAVGC